jgi:predicted dehydrogenase
VWRAGGWLGGHVRWLAGALLDGPYAASDWRQRRGALFDVGPHAFDLLDAALGPITEVLAARHRPDADHWQVIFGHDGGATSTAALSLRLPITPSVSDVSVYGTAGLRTLGPVGMSSSDCFAVLLDDLLALITGGTTEHRCDLRRGLHLQRVIAMVADRVAGA